jgi:hypothetical protein
MNNKRKMKKKGIKLKTEERYLIKKEISEINV